MGIYVRVREKVPKERECVQGKTGRSSGRATYMNMCGRGKGRILETTPHVGGESRRVPGGTPCAHIEGKRTGNFNRGAITQR